VPEAAKLKEVLTRSDRMNRAIQEYNQGKSKLRQRQYTQALAHLKRAAAVKDSPVAPKAEKELRAIREKINQAVKSGLAEGDKHESGQRPKAAYAAYQRVLREYPKSDYAGLVRDRMNSIKKNTLDKASKLLADAQRLLKKKEFVACREAIADLKALGKDLPELSEAEELLGELRTAITKTCTHLRSRAKNAELLEQKDKARQLWKRIVKLAPRSTFAQEAQRHLD
jgi:outer membrane protein assembly factor BamD (BamD/ComL family)